MKIKYLLLALSALMMAQVVEAIFKKPQSYRLGFVVKDRGKGCLSSLLPGCGHCYENALDLQCECQGLQGACAKREQQYKANILKHMQQYRA